MTEAEIAAIRTRDVGCNGYSTRCVEDRRALLAEVEYSHARIRALDANLVALSVSIRELEAALHNIATNTLRKLESRDYTPQRMLDIQTGLNIDAIEAALQALADEFAVHAAKGTAPAIDDPTLVAAVDLLAANRGGEQ